METRIQVYDLDPAEPAYSAFVKCTMVVYGWHMSPSHSFWIVPGTVAED